MPLKWLLKPLPYLPGHLLQDTTDLTEAVAAFGAVVTVVAVVVADAAFLVATFLAAAAAAAAAAVAVDYTRCFLAQ